MDIIAENIKYSLLKGLTPYQKNIQDRVDETTFEKNIFLMMKYRNDNIDFSDFIIETLSKLGLNGIRADMEDWNLTEDNVINPLAVLYCCKYGISLFDKPEKGQNFSPNVAYELGIMHLQNKNCLILIHDSIVNKKPFDLISKLHKTYSNELSTRKLITSWVRENKIGGDSKHSVELFKIVLAVIKWDNRFILTERSQREGKLSWGIPAAILKPFEDEATALQKECYNEINLNIKPVLRIGDRIHPDTGAHCIYWLCDYVSGEIENKQPEELLDIRWTTGKEALQLMTSDVYVGLKEILSNT